jgi:ammonium transporter Rh
MLKAFREARPFSWMLLMFQLFLIIIYFVGMDYDDKPKDPRSDAPSDISPEVGKHSDVASWYWYFNHIVFMMPIGFGYLVTFLRKYRYSGVGFTFVLTALIFQWSLVITVFWRKVRTSPHWPGRASVDSTPPLWTASRGAFHHLFSLI